jgi:hypothetical protein
MASAFGRKTPVMDSSEYTTVKKATSLFCIHPRVNDYNLTRAGIFSYPGVPNRIIISTEPRSGSGITRILNFIQDPTNPKRFIQDFS